MRGLPAGSASPASPGSIVPPSPGGQDSGVTHLPPQIPDHQLLQPIGRGAYGEVWLARNIVGTPRAVKVVYRRDFGDEHPFDREFKGIQKFEPISRSHPGVVNILQIGRNEVEGYFYYVMELADDAAAERSNGVMESRSYGKPSADQSTSQALRHSTTMVPQHSSTPSLQHSSSYAPRTLRSDLKLRGRLPFESCLQLALSLTSALEHLHQHGLVHRDVKPSNIIFVNGQPKLADIGLVAGVDEARSFVGTEGFIPPEGPGKPQADLYSLGIMLYVMSTGKRHDAFPEPLTDLASDPDHQRWLEWNAVIHKACHADPRERYQSAGEMHADLLRLQAGKSVRRQQRWARAMKLGKQAAPIAAVASVLVLSATWMMRRQAFGPAVVPAEKASVFVLPFRIEGSNAVPNDLSGRITDAFIDSLALIDGVRRSPRKSGWVHQDEDLLRRSLAETNDMRQVLAGRINGSGDMLTLTLRLYRRTEAEPVWSESFSGTTNDVAALARRALAQLVSTLGLKTTEIEQTKLDQLLTNNLEALRWLRQAAVVYDTKGGTQEGHTEVQTLAQKALELDPGYLDAECLNAVVSRDIAMERAPREGWFAVGILMEKILKQDDTQAGALDQMAGYTLFFNRNWSGGMVLVDRLLAAEDAQNAAWLGALFYRTCGWFEEARILQEKSETPEPINSAQRYHMAAARRVAGHYAEGVQISRRTVQLHRKNWWGYQSLAHCLVEQGELVQGLEAIEKAQEIWPKQEMTALKAYAYAKLGQADKAWEVLGELMNLRRTSPYLQPYFVARVYAALGENAAALDWLEKADADRSEYLLLVDVGGLRTDPAWGGLQNEPRYWQLCDRLGLGKKQWPRPKPEKMP